MFRRGAGFARDDRGSEILEYALVISLFALVCMVTINLMGVTANKRVETDQTNYTNAFVNGY
jgi:Flp pilus assembly pilin Flp